MPAHFCLYIAMTSRRVAHHQAADAGRKEADLATTGCLNPLERLTIASLN
jgi:hypothetical protein